MSEQPQILLSYTFPPESPGTMDEFTAVLDERRPQIEYVRATDRTDFIKKAPDAEIIVEHGLPEEVLDAVEDLQWVQSLSAGVNRYNRERLQSDDILLTTVSGAHASAIAQQTMAYLLLFERNLLRGFRQANNREWRRYPAGELTGHSVGIVGVGAVGGNIAELASAFGMEVHGLRRHPDRPHEHVDMMYGPEDLHKLIGISDYVVLACPLTDKTYHLIDESALSSMRTGTVLINVSRGRVVDQSALIDSLSAGNLRGAALDVTDPEPLPADSPLWNFSNVLITPHNAGGSQHFPEQCANIFLENYEMFLSGEVDAMENRVI